MVIVGQRGERDWLVINGFVLPLLQQTSVWPNWYGVQDDLSTEEPAPTPPPASSFSHLDMPPPYEAVSGGNPGDRSAIFICFKVTRHFALVGAKRVFVLATTASCLSGRSWQQAASTTASCSCRVSSSEGLLGCGSSGWGTGDLWGHVPPPHLPFLLSHQKDLHSSVL